MSNDPYKSYNFHLLFEGVTMAGFTEASGLGANHDVIAYREGGAGSEARHHPGQLSYTPLALRYGVTQERALLDWFESTLVGNVERRNVSLLLYDADGVTEAIRWNLFSAWPAQYTVAPLDSASNSVTIESATFVYDRIERD